MSHPVLTALFVVLSVGVIGYAAYNTFMEYVDRETGWEPHGADGGGRRRQYRPPSPDDRPGARADAEDEWPLRRRVRRVDGENTDDVGVKDVIPPSERGKMGRTGDIVAGTFVADAGSAVESTSAAQVRDQAPQFVPTVATRIPSGQGNERSPEASIADPHESASVADFSSEAPAETNGSQDDEWTDLGDTGSVISR